MTFAEMKWFELWFEDKESILSTMVSNMQSDLDAGYNPSGNSIQSQIAEIANYKASIDSKLDEFSKMDEKSVNRWCYYDLKRRGAI